MIDTGNSSEKITMEITKKQIIIGIIVLGIILMGIVIVNSQKFEITEIKCNEEDPIKRLMIKIKLLQEPFNPFPPGVQPFSKEGAIISARWSEFKKECIDKW